VLKYVDREQVYILQYTEVTFYVIGDVSVKCGCLIFFMFAVTCDRIMQWICCLHPPIWSCSPRTVTNQRHIRRGFVWRIPWAGRNRAGSQLVSVPVYSARHSLSYLHLRSQAIAVTQDGEFC